MVGVRPSVVAGPSGKPTFSGVKAAPRWFNLEALLPCGSLPVVPCLSGFWMDDRSVLRGFEDLERSPYLWGMRWCALFLDFRVPAGTFVPRVTARFGSSTQNEALNVPALY
jgi:hypothetical protein